MIEPGVELETGSIPGGFVVKNDISFHTAPDND